MVASADDGLTWRRPALGLAKEAAEQVKKREQDRVDGLAAKLRDKATKRGAAGYGDDTQMSIDARPISSLSRGLTSLRALWWA